MLRRWSRGCHHGRWPTGTLWDTRGPNMVATLAFGERDTAIKHVGPIPVEGDGGKLLDDIKRYELNRQARYVRYVPLGDENISIAMAHDVQIPDELYLHLFSRGHSETRFFHR